MGFFSGLDIEQYDRQYNDRDLIARILQFFKPYVKVLSYISVLILVASLFTAASPILVSKMVDTLQEGFTITEAFTISGIIFVLGGMSWLINWERRRKTTRVTGDVIMNIQAKAFDASVGHDLSFYDDIASGKIVSRITSDTREFGNVINLVTDLIGQITQAFIVGIALVTTTLNLSLYVFGAIPLVFLVALGFRNMARKVTRKGFRAMANVNSTIKETVSGISVAKNFRQEGVIFQEFNEANQSSFRVNMQRGLVLSLIFPTMNALSGVLSGFILYIGGVNIASSIITAGAWYLFLQSLDQFWIPVINLSSFWTQLQAGLSAAERAFALIDAEPRVVQTDQKIPEKLRGEIEFRGVNFQYTSQERVLIDFNLNIHPGENLAFVGHTGAGKSSIARLVARFYEFQSGEILIDGEDIRSFDLKAYRQQLGIISQSPFLFSGTVMDNICYSSKDVELVEVEKLAHSIGDGEWVGTLPRGFDTQVGERGSRLSMGQRQLVALMRVLVRKPAIFILDEATASIDPFTEWQIQQALNMILKETTSILIAHRLSTVKAADRIIVLQDGGMLEEGNHAELLAIQGNYADLYNTYFRHQSLAYIEKLHHT
ncbi:MAG: ABC transporter ATP-binding protein [Anaerolineales bacterium]|nr:ABC transporter ATP-binding protein [Anaerolineales bacterium]